jgi:hypothetical protein
MPLYASGLRKIRSNLLQIEAGQKPFIVAVGFFTPEQLCQINAARISSGFPALRPEIKFHGGHLYRSRCLKDSYTVDQVIEQIESAFSKESVVDSSRPSVVLYNPTPRMDREGNLVTDKVVFECTGMYPYALLYSVVPKGDGKKKPTKATGSLGERPCREQKDVYAGVTVFFPDLNPSRFKLCALFANMSSDNRPGFPRPTSSGRLQPKQIENSHLFIPSLFCFFTHAKGPHPKRDGPHARKNPAQVRVGLLKR